MKGMNLSGKPGMVQPMQMPPTFGQPPMPSIQPRFGDVAVHDRTPAAELHDALRRAVFVGKVSLLVVTGAIAAFVDGLSEQPRRAQLVVERDHRRQDPRPDKEGRARFPSCCPAARDIPAR